jgi:hypothetical protein
MFSIDQGASAGAWWLSLAGTGVPKVIARLPFIERPSHPAGTPVYVISKPLADAAVRDVVLYSVRLERWRDAFRPGIAALGGEVIASAGQANGLAALLAVPGTVEPATLRSTLDQAGAGVVDIAEVGSHAQRFSVNS